MGRSQFTLILDPDRRMFIEMTGKTLANMLHEDELGAISLEEVGVTETTVVRVN